jgi:hypothetical protein
MGSIIVTQGHFFKLFPTLCLYFRTVVFHFGSVVGEPTRFSFLGSFAMPRPYNHPCSV